MICKVAKHWTTRGVAVIIVENGHGDLSLILDEIVYISHNADNLWERYEYNYSLPNYG